MNKSVILTGLRANSEFHLGNYLGAILPMVELQKQHAGEYQINMFVPDLHSFTTPIEHGSLYQNVLDNLKLIVASGFDIQQPDTFVYRQSRVPAHSELTWILSCFTYFGELGRMTQFKDKSEGKDNVSVGLFTYPVLMAADILLYDARYIPLGEDQRQHLELTRDIAERINNKFGAVLTLPEPWDKQLAFAERDSVRIRSLRNPEKKMSKSVDDPGGTIMLTDNPEEAAKKVMAATTDSVGAIHLDWEKQPGISNLLQIAALLTSKSLDETAKAWDGKSNYGELKAHVSELVQSCLTTVQTNLREVSEQDIVTKLEQDETAMRNVAEAKLRTIQAAVGLYKK